MKYFDFYSNIIHIMLSMSQYGMDLPMHESDPLKRHYKKGNYIPPPKRKESKKEKRRRKLGKR